MSSWSKKFDKIAEDAAKPEDSEPFIIKKMARFHIGNISTFGLTQEEAVACYHKVKILNTDQPTRYILYLPEEQLRQYRAGISGNGGNA